MEHDAHGPCFQSENELCKKKQQHYFSVKLVIFYWSFSFHD